MQPCCHVTSLNQIDIILSLNSILKPWNKTNLLKNLHQHQLITPEEDDQHKDAPHKDAPHTFEE